jgi:hypothetical protein
VHIIIPNEWEWMNLLSCVNAASGYIPHLYIFKGKRMRMNYIIMCETEAIMAIRSKAWMTSFLFSTWIGYFV